MTAFEIALLRVTEKKKKWRGYTSLVISLADTKTETTVWLSKETRAKIRKLDEERQSTTKKTKSTKADRKTIFYDPNKWDGGTKLWNELHIYCANPTGDPIQWISEWEEQLPKTGCKCRDHWSEVKKECPVDLQNLLDWSWKAHNLVNIKLNKPQMSFLAASVHHKWPINIGERSNCPVLSAAFVISMAKTPDRLSDFRNRFPSDWKLTEGPVEHFPGVDGASCGVPKNWNWDQTSHAVIGCRQSWIDCLKLCKSRDYKLPVMIMEDDCQFCEGAEVLIREGLEKVPSGWQILFPGGQNDSPTIPVLPGLVKSTGTGRTHCLIINPQYLAKMIEEVESYKSHVDWGLKAIAKVSQYYCLDPFVAIQGANLSILRGILEPPRGWDNRIRLPDGVHKTRFQHSGDLGDLIYALPTIRAMTGDTPATLFLTPVNYTRRRMSQQVVDEIRTLLEAQEYIGEVIFSEQAIDTFDLSIFDLNGWRQRRTSGMYNIADRTLDTGSWSHAERDTPWLKVTPQRISKIIISRSMRYRNPKMPWKAILLAYPGATFIGTSEEHQDFERMFGTIPRYLVDNYLEIAQVIAGCYLFIGNQSSPYAIAEGLKKLTIQEMCEDPSYHNCHFERPTATYIMNGSEPLPRLDSLTDDLTGGV